MLKLKFQRKFIQLALQIFRNGAVVKYFRRHLRKIEIELSNESLSIKKEVDLFFKINLLESDFLMYEKFRPISFSQCRQDLIIGLINLWSPGVIIEVGATDGLLLSNSVLLEKYLGWKSILVEPSRSWHNSLKSNRTYSNLIFDAVSHTPNLSLLFTETEFAELSGLSDSLPNDFWTLERKNSINYYVNTTTLDEICDKYELNEIFLAITIDIEGGELDALRGFTKKLSLADLLVIENNGNNKVIHSLDELLLNREYVRLIWPFESFDSWYLRKDWLEKSLVINHLLQIGVLNIKELTSL